MVRITQATRRGGQGTEYASAIAKSRWALLQSERGLIWIHQLAFWS